MSRVLRSVRRNHSMEIRNITPNGIEMGNTMPDQNAGSNTIDITTVALRTRLLIKFRGGPEKLERVLDARTDLVELRGIDRVVVARGGP